MSYKKDIVYLFQSNEVRNSYALELEGLRRSLSYLTSENNIRVTELVTDRHSSVKSIWGRSRLALDTSLMCGT